MKKLFEDPWAQLFAFAALVSGAMTAHALITRGGLPRLELPADWGALSAPLASVRQPMRLDASKSPGRWVVDQAGGADSDTDQIAQALASAREGDRVLVRPGTYRESLILDKTVTLEGTGKEAGEVLLVGVEGPGVSLAAGSAVLKNLWVAREAPDAGAAIAVAGGSLSLEGCGVSTATVGVELRGPGSKARLLESVLRQNRTGLSAEGGAEAVINASQIRHNAGAAVKASGASSVTVADTTLVLNGQGVLAQDGAKAEVSASTVAENGRAFVAEDAEISDFASVLYQNREAGVEASGKSTVKLDQTRIFVVRKDGVRAAAGATLILNRVLISGAQGAGIVLSGGAELHLARSSISGSRRCGLEIDAAAAFLDFAKLDHNECGVAFTGRGRLQSNDGDFAGNDKGPLLYAREHLSGIYLRGKGNAPPDFQALFR